LGDVLVNFKRNTEAVQCFRTALKLHPNEAGALLGLGTALLNEAASPGNIREARGYLLRAVQLYERSLTVPSGWQGRAVLLNLTRVQ
jgi:cytochrome c-type biogenesis protein CcmH/NrfG